MRSNTLTILMLALGFSSQVHSISFSAKVTAVHDGDTIEVVTGTGGKVNIRLTQIDAPELKQSYGKRSKRNLEKYVLGKSILLSNVKEDVYGRKTALVICSKNNINLRQVNDGYAWSLIKKTESNYTHAENKAQYYKKGLWNEESPIPPWQFR